MKKQALLRGILGFPLGVALGQLITIAGSAVAGYGTYSPVVPEFAADAEPYIRPKNNSGKFLVDLRGALRCRLLQLGLAPEHIAVSDECTVCLHEKYWSHRYSKGQRGSQCAVICL